MGMAHSTSGRRGYTPLRLSPAMQRAVLALGHAVDDNTILRMLRRENELRLSPETQEKYKAGGLAFESFAAVTEAVQRQVPHVQVSEAISVAFNFKLCYMYADYHRLPQSLALSQM